MNVIAVDVGTTSVRLAIISFQGEKCKDVIVLANHSKDIDYVQDGCKFEQNSMQIWEAICECCKESLKGSNVPASSIKSISFSATCSLVVVSNKETSVHDNDIIMWMDHRAIEEANEITESGDRVLKQFGGVCSPEFSLAKLVWLKKHARERFDSAIGLFELPDWLVYKCLAIDPGCCPRSLDCVVSKWGFDSRDKSNCLPVSQLLDSIQDKIGVIYGGPGSNQGFMSEQAVRELGLWFDGDGEFPKVMVGSGMIDAHAGMVAMFSAQSAPIEGTLCSLTGTSSCHMFMSDEDLFVHGIWGPYYGALLESKTLYETGQSLTGKLIEIVIESHEEGKIQLKNGKSMYSIIHDLNESLKQYPSNGASPIDDQFLILPTFHGNRSPLANPRLKGGIYGLSAEGSKSLLEYYVATVESLAFEMRFIVEKLKTSFQRIIASGGLTKNHFYIQTLANVLECDVTSMSFGDVDAMVMGSGLAALTAAFGRCNISDLSTIPMDESGIKNFRYKQLETKIYKPEPHKLPSLNKKYKCYKEFVQFSVRVDEIMNERNTGN